jgi:small subunit ribosomal protein S2
MLKAIFDWFKQPSPKAFAPAVQPEAAPYKVETPQIAPVLEATPVVPEPAPAPVAEVKKPAAKKPAAKKPAAKPAAMKAPAKKPATKKPAAKKPQ